jgi:hypothetical protein
MGTYVSVRGWIELDHSQRPAAEEIIEQARDDLYSDGWSFPAKPFNWTLYVFYGGDIRVTALPWIHDQIVQLAALPPVDDDGDRPAGLLLVTHEHGQTERWEIRDGSVHAHPAAEFDWLTV